MKGYTFKRFAKDITSDLVGCFLYAIGIMCFAKNAGFAPGGVNGLSIVINHLTGLQVGTVQFLLNIPLILISFRILGIGFILRSGKTMIIMSVMLNIVGEVLPAYNGSPMLAAIFTGIFVGIGIVIIYINGGSSGGTDFLTLSIKKKKPHLSIPLISSSMDVFVLIIGGIAFGNIDASLYGAISVVVGGLVIDKILYGVGAGKMAMIITNKGDEVAKAIDKMTGRGSSILKVKGSYTGQDKDMVLSAMSKHQIFPARRIAHEVDPESFVIISSTDEVFGQGFMENKD